MFSTDPVPKKSKSKCVFFHRGREAKPAPVLLRGRPLLWVDQAAHLGHELHCSGSQDLDCIMARGSYIGTSNEILNMFNFATPEQKLKAVQTYACTWYGAMLWNLYSPAAGKAFRSWNTSVKMAHCLPRQTHTYIVEHYLAGQFSSVRQMIIRRYVKFVQSLLNSPNGVISQLANVAVVTVRSVTGLNIKNIREEFGKDPLFNNRNCFYVNQTEIPENGQNNIELIDYLLFIRSNETDEEILTELNEIIFDVCTD